LRLIVAVFADIEPFWEPFWLVALVVADAGNGRLLGESAVAPLSSSDVGLVYG